MHKISSTILSYNIIFFKVIVLLIDIFNVLLCLRFCFIKKNTYTTVIQALCCVLRLTYLGVNQLIQLISESLKVLPN